MKIVDVGVYESSGAGCCFTHSKERYWSVTVEDNDGVRYEAIGSSSLEDALLYCAERVAEQHEHNRQIVEDAKRLEARAKREARKAKKAATK